MFSIRLLSYYSFNLFLIRVVGAVGNLQLNQLTMNKKVCF